jgi:hypothetical protein
MNGTRTVPETHKNYGHKGRTIPRKIDQKVVVGALDAISSEMHAQHAPSKDEVQRILVHHANGAKKRQGEYPTGSTVSKTYLHQLHPYTTKIPE